jgi:hypothetical protein
MCIFSKQIVKTAIFTITIIFSSLFLTDLTKTAKAQFLDYAGNDFIIAFMPNLFASGKPITLELHLIGKVNTIVTVEYPVNSPTFSTTVAVNPGSITVLTIPLSAATSWPIGATANNAVHVRAQDEFVCYLISRRQHSTDAALALPVDVFNTEYIVMSYVGASHGGDKSEFVVVAGFDNTTVTITPVVDMIGGFSAGTSFDITLNRGEGFLAQSLLNIGPEADLTGTIIRANRPVGVSNGSVCAYVPQGNEACDHLFEVAQPTQTWGKEVFVTNLPNRPRGSIYRILASADSTIISMDASPIDTLNRGEFHETKVLTGSHVFSGTKPIFVVQYMTGVIQSGAGIGDPAMANMIPREQYLTAYTFSTIGGGQFRENFVTIIVENSDVGSMTLDGANIPASAFTPISGTDFSSAIMRLSHGTHTTISNHGHGITVEGYDTDDSYIYPGGARFEIINHSRDTNPPICEVSIFDDTAHGSAKDNRPSEDINGNGILDPGEDLNGNGRIDEDTGIFFVALEPGSDNLQLDVDPFTPGDSLVTFEVTLLDSNRPGAGIVTATDGDGNKCSTSIKLEVKAPLYPFTDTLQTAGDSFWVDIDIGTATQPVSRLFGINFVLHYDGTHAELVPPHAEHIVLGGFLGDGNRVIFFPRKLQGDSISIAITRKAGDTNASGFGTLARVKFRTPPDTPDSTRIRFAITSITAIDSANNPVYLTPGDLWVTILQKRVEVWPGDTNNDSVVNGVDVLFVGFYWNSTGPVRSGPSLDWIGQSVIVWRPEMATYADADGNGKVNEADVLPIGINWGKTHGLGKSVFASTLTSATEGSIKTTVISGTAQGEFYVAVEATEITDLFGIAFELMYPNDQMKVLSVEPGSLWGSGTLFHFSDAHSKGILGIGASLTDRSQKLTGNGHIARIRIKAKPEARGNDVLPMIYLNNIVAMNHAGERIGLANETLAQVNDLPATPKEFRLHQNFPNPFNASTLIRYELPVSSRVTIKIFAVVGVEVTTLMDREEEAGAHQIVWDGTDSRGGTVSSGVYLYKIVAGDHQEVRKCVLMK